MSTTTETVVIKSDLPVFQTRFNRSEYKNNTRKVVTQDLLLSGSGGWL